MATQKKTFTEEEFEVAAKNERLNKICKQVLKLEDVDFAWMESVATKQRQYMHPLKGAKQAKLNKTGQNNLKVIAAIRNLKALIEKGAKT